MTEGRRDDENSCCNTLIELVQEAKDDTREDRSDRYYGEGPLDPYEERLATRIVDRIEGDKYLKIHGSSLGTLEFRHHHGSVDEEEITMWVQFLHAFIDASIVKYKGRDSLWRGIPKDVKKYYLKKKKFYDEIYPRATASTRRSRRSEDNDSYW
jgi:hypothetical protein